MICEVEIDNDQNCDLLFQPLGERVRGAFLPARVRQESAGKLAMALPRGLPGQRLRLNTETGEGAIIEPLADPAHADTRKTIARLITGDDAAAAERIGFAPAVRTVKGVHVPTWLAYMVKAVRAGYAKLVKGELPKEPPADAQPRVFSSLSRPQDPTRAFGFGDVLAVLANLTPDQRKQMAAAINAGK